MQNDWSEHLEHRLADWAGHGLTRRLRTVAGCGTHFSLDGRQVCSFATNDYLGLACDPRVVRAAQEALGNCGSGATSSPLIAGHREIHARLAQALALSKRTSAALLFPSGYQAALATLGALAGPDETLILDRLAHASLLDGAKLSGARLRVFKHNDARDLERLLEHENGRRCLVAVESVYSMDGDLAPLSEYLALTERFGALLLVDEAHATGVLGRNGCGLLEDSVSPVPALACKESDKNHGAALPEHVIALGTLSKALGSQGGFICATRLIVDMLTHAGRALMFSTGLAPSAAAAAHAALEIVHAEPQRRRDLLENARRVRDELERRGFKSIPSPSPIIPILLGDEHRASAFAERLLARGFHVPAIRFPTVKTGHARLRLSLSAAHTREDIENLLACLGKG